MDTGLLIGICPRVLNARTGSAGQSGCKVAVPHFVAVPDAKLADPASANDGQVGRASART